jgi:hypothetical protein
MFNNEQLIFIDRLVKECLLSDNNFIRFYYFFVVNNYKIVSKVGKANIVILDLCGVNKLIPKHAIKEIKNYQNLNKSIILL